MLLLAVVIFEDRLIRCYPLYCWFLMRSLAIGSVLIVNLDIRLRRKLLGKCPVSLLSLRPRCIKSSLTLACGPWDHEWGCLSPLSPSIGTEGSVCELCVLHLHLCITRLLIDSSSLHLEFYKVFQRLTGLRMTSLLFLAKVRYSDMSSKFLSNISRTLKAFGCGIVIRKLEGVSTS